MVRIFLMVIFTSIGFLTNGIAVAQAPPALLANPLTVGLILDEVEGTSNRIIENAGDEARGVAIEAGAQMRLVIANARVAYADSLDKTVSELKGERRQIFNDTLAVLSRLEKGASSGLESAEQIAELGGIAIDGLPIAPGIPRVRKVSPIYATESNSKLGVEVVVKGLSLRSGKPKVLINGESAEVLRSISTELSFLMPSLQTEPGRIQSFSTRLEIPYRTGLRLFERRATFYLIGYIVPDQMGSVKMRWVYKTVREERKTLRCPDVGSYTSRSDGGRGSRTSTHRCPIDAGWTPDRTTFSVVEDGSNRCQDLRGSVSDVELSYSVKCNAYGPTVLEGTRFVHSNVRRQVF